MRKLVGPRLLARLLCTLVTLALGAPLGAAAAAAVPEQDFPSRPVRLVVPFAAGGPADFVARAIAPGLERALGQPCLVDNRPGADGAIGALAVRTAAADGHTLLLAGGSLVAMTLVKKAPPFDLRAHFAPVSRIAPSPWALYVSATLPVQSIGELLAHARAQPDALSVATSTLSDQLAAAQFMKATGTSLVRVPYKGAGQAIPDLIAGRVQLNFSPLSAAALAQVQAGKLRLLAVLAPERSAVVPSVPTLAEAGVSGVSVPGWLALFAPVGTPPAIIARLHRAVGSALAEPSTRALLVQQAVQTDGSAPEALAAQIEADFRLWSAFVREQGISPE